MEKPKDLFISAFGCYTARSLLHSTTAQGMKTKTDGNTALSASPLTAARRLVVKISSALLVGGERDEIRRSWLDALTGELAARKKLGCEVIVVSSGAVALGRRVLGLKKGALRLDEMQAAAACGQARLAHAWQESLERQGLRAAQVLLTPRDTEERQSYLNIRAALRGLLAMGVVPVVNENDTVGSPAMCFSDNDQLSARVAAMMESDCLALLSDVEGLYTADPRQNPNAEFVSVVRSITPEIAAMAGGSSSGLGRGGMATKLEAAKMAMLAGCSTVIAKGGQDAPLRAIADGGRCTWFLAERQPAAAWKRWIAGTLNPRGSIGIDAGAVSALRRGGSLLPVGVTSADGDFSGGDPVRVLSPDGHEVARGLVSFSRDEVLSVKGRKSGEMADILGYPCRDEIIHRDDMALV